MGVNKRFLPMRVDMRLACRVVRAVRVLMVFVMQVRMRVRRYLVRMGMLMMFGDVQPDADTHQYAREQ